MSSKRRKNTAYPGSVRRRCRKPRWKLRTAATAHHASNRWPQLNRPLARMRSAATGIGTRHGIDPPPPWRMTADEPSAGGSDNGRERGHADRRMTRNSRVWSDPPVPAAGTRGGQTGLDHNSVRDRLGERGRPARSRAGGRSDPPRTEPPHATCDIITMGGNERFTKVDTTRSPQSRGAAHDIMASPG